MREGRRAWEGQARRKDRAWARVCSHIHSDVHVAELTTTRHDTEELRSETVIALRLLYAAVKTRARHRDGCLYCSWRPWRPITVTVYRIIAAIVVVPRNERTIADLGHGHGSVMRFMAVGTCDYMGTGTSHPSRPAGHGEMLEISEIIWHDLQPIQPMDGWMSFVSKLVS